MYHVEKKMTEDEMLQQFQEDLRKGMTIQEACTKYQITLDYAFKHMPKTITKTRKKQGKSRKITKKQGRPQKFHRREKSKIPYIACHEKNITCRYGKYFLRKRTRGKERVYGTYETLEDAVKIRDYCNEHGWYVTRIDEYCEILGIKRCCKTNKKSKEMYHK